MEPLVGMSDEEKAYAYLTTTPGWDLAKQMAAQDKMFTLNLIADRSQKRKDQNNDEVLWGEIRGVEKFIRRIETVVKEAAQRELDMLSEQRE